MSAGILNTGGINEVVCILWPEEQDYVLSMGGIPFSIIQYNRKREAAQSGHLPFPVFCGSVKTASGLRKGPLGF